MAANGFGRVPFRGVVSRSSEYVSFVGWHGTTFPIAKLRLKLRKKTNIKGKFGSRTTNGTCWNNYFWQPRPITKLEIWGGYNTFNPAHVAHNTNCLYCSGSWILASSWANCLLVFCVLSLVLVVSRVMDEAGFLITRTYPLPEKTMYCSKQRQTKYDQHNLCTCVRQIAWFQASISA